MSVAFLFDHADIILSELKLLTTTLGVLYLASHASLRRPPSAAPVKKTGPGGLPGPVALVPA